MVKISGPAAKNQFLFCIFLLIIAGAIWGMGFVALKWTLVGFGPFWSNGIRYIIAAVFSLPLLLFFRSWKRDKQFFIHGLVASSFLFMGVIFQVFGLKYTSVAKCSFLTSLYAFFVPLILLVTGKKKLGRAYWGLLLICLFGIALLCDLKIDKFNIGDFYTLFCAFFLSLHILYLEKISSQMQNGFEFNCLQCLLIGLMAPVVALIFEGRLNLSLINFNPFVIGPLLGFLILGIFSSIIAFGIQVYAQKIIPSHIVGPFFLLESPFGALFGYLFLNEALRSINILGCVIIVIAVAAIPLTESWRPQLLEK